MEESQRRMEESQRRMEESQRQMEESQRQRDEVMERMAHAIALIQADIVRIDETR
jgi:predicted transcriptional regulator